MIINRSKNYLKYLNLPSGFDGETDPIPEPDLIPDQGAQSTTSFPGSSLFSRKDPGNSWLCDSQILGAKLKLYLGRGGRGVCLLCLENYNLCVIVSGDKIYICNKKSWNILYLLSHDFLYIIECWVTLVKWEVGSDFSGHQGLATKARFAQFIVKIFPDWRFFQYWSVSCPTRKPNWFTLCRDVKLL
jgi:hypothetical protein